MNAKWDGKSLISEEKTSRGKFSRTFELAPNGQQLYETVRIDASAYGSRWGRKSIFSTCMTRIREILDSRTVCLEEKHVQKNGAPRPFTAR